MSGDSGTPPASAQDGGTPQAPDLDLMAAQPGAWAFDELWGAALRAVPGRTPLVAAPAERRTIPADAFSGEARSDEVTFQIVAGHPQAPDSVRAQLARVAAFLTTHHWHVDGPAGDRAPGPAPELVRDAAGAGAADASMAAGTGRVWLRASKVHGGVQAYVSATGWTGQWRLDLFGQTSPLHEASGS